MFVLVQRNSGHVWTCRTIHVSDSLRAAQRMDRTTLVTFDTVHDAQYVACRFLYRKHVFDGQEPLAPRLRLDPLTPGKSVVRVRWEETPWVMPPVEKLALYWNQLDANQLEVALITPDILSDWCVSNELPHLHLPPSSTGRGVFQPAPTRSLANQRTHLQRIMARSTGGFHDDVDLHSNDLFYEM